MTIGYIGIPPPPPPPPRCRMYLRQGCSPLPGHFEIANFSLATKINSHSRVGWFLGTLRDWMVLHVVGWFVWLVGWLVCLLVGWLVGWLVDWLFGCLVGWLVDWFDWLVGWLGGLVGCLVGWLGWSVDW